MGEAVDGDRCTLSPVNSDRGYAQVSAVRRSSLPGVGQQGGAETAVFGAELRRWREAAGLSLSGLARQVSYSRSYLSKIETGAKPAGAELAKRCDTALRAGGALAGLAVPRPREPRKPVPDTAPADVPRQLPSAVRHFVGRDRELDLLSQRVRADLAAVITIHGSAGVGKTSLAVHWARTMQDRFPDGQLYLNLRGFEASGRPMTTDEAVRRFLDGLGVAAESIPAESEAQLALYRSRTDGRRMLVVLDNAADTEQVRALLPGSSSAVVLITSRRQLTGLIARDHVEPVTLDPLSVDEASELLTGLIGARRSGIDGELLDELAHRCARLPLALSILGARLASDDYLELATLTKQLDAEHSRLTALSTGDGADTDIRAVFSWSYRAVSTDAARLFRLLGSHPGPHIGRAAITSLAGEALHPQRIDALLGELASAHLIEQIAPGRFWFHDLLRAYAAELGEERDSEQERNATTARVLDHYLHTGHAAARLLSPSRDSLHLEPVRLGTVPESLTDFDEAIQWFDTEYAVLLSVIAEADTTNIDKLAWTLETFFPRRGRWHDQLSTQQLALTAARRSGNISAQARAHRSIGRAYCWLGKESDSQHHYRQALQQYAGLDDAVGCGHTCLGIVWSLERNGHYAKALAYAKESLAFYRVSGQAHWEARGLNAVAWCQARCGHHAEALRLCAQALPLHRRLHDRHSESATLGIMGYACEHLGEYRTAVSYYHSALHLVRELRDPYSEALVLRHLGDAYCSIGDPDSARKTWTKAVGILDGLDSPDAATIRGKLRTLPG